MKVVKKKDDKTANGEVDEIVSEDDDHPTNKSE
jgi:hypothetical protein